MEVRQTTPSSSPLKKGENRRTVLPLFMRRRALDVSRGVSPRRLAVTYLKFETASAVLFKTTPQLTLEARRFGTIFNFFVSLIFEWRCGKEPPLAPP